MIKFEFNFISEMFFFFKFQNKNEDDCYTKVVSILKDCLDICTFNFARADAKCLKIEIQELNSHIRTEVHMNHIFFENQKNAAILI